MTLRVLEDPEKVSAKDMIMAFYDRKFLAAVVLNDQLQMFLDRLLNFICLLKIKLPSVT